ncbi:hypothetical protein [Wenjunlia vitaminophila]|uniref:hypothetical protein n=1 Tax=Wenjunlia vitaminophila TaxID=76728 RepID=UPI00035D59DD|nr:hypothetical protein [Wenjunlia vitaminophila]
MSCGKCLFDPPKPPYGSQYQGARVDFDDDDPPQETTTPCGHAECAAAEAAPHRH